MASLSHSLASWSALSDSVASLSCSCSRSMPIMSCLREEWLAESAMPVPATNIVTNKNLPPNRVACIIPPPFSSSFPDDCALRRQRTEKVTRQPSLIEERRAYVVTIRSTPYSDVQPNLDSYPIFPKANDKSRLTTTPVSRGTRTEREFD